MSLTRWDADPTPVTVGRELPSTSPAAPGWFAITDSGLQVELSAASLTGLRTLRAGQRVQAALERSGTTLTAIQVQPLHLPDPADGQ